MAKQIAMPQLGESVVEGKIVAWFVKPGDTVEQGATLVEVETDKANTEVPSPVAGTITRIIAAAGAIVPVGAPIIEIGEPGEASAPAPAPAPAPVAAPAAPAPVAAPAASAAHAPVAPAPTPAPLASAGAPSTSEAAPLPRTAHRRADDVPWNANNIVAAPTQAPASLPMARSSVGAAALEAVAGPFGAPPGLRHYRAPQVAAGEGDTVVPFSKRRAIISEHMVYSKHVSPHVPCFAEVDVTPVMAVRGKHKKRLEAEGVGLSLLAFVLKATCIALREFPSVNATVGEDSVILRGHVHLGVAVETDAGLLVPVIRDADALSVGGLARAVGDIAERARSKKIGVDELNGGTFTVSNPGRRGNLFGAAIINQPQVGILRMGEIVRRAVVREIDGEEVICIRSMMFLGLSYDHRIIDGVTGNGFLFRIRELLEAAEFDV
ncbi:MAG: 2-oxo acid dehydrogenase subunit E2 [Myxococcales bacterium]|nr:2-oxo acid dehydrogenase subunit E2 [Myxococcales bacterium]